MRRLMPCRSPAGFTLLEVLVALLIAGLALGVLAQGAATGLQTADLVARQELALSRARSHLAAAVRSGIRVATTQEGDDGGGYRWMLRVRPLASALVAPRGRAAAAAARDPAASRLTLFDVEVVVSWPAGRQRRSVRLESQLLASDAGGGHAP